MAIMNSFQLATNKKNKTLLTAITQGGEKYIYEDH